MNRQEEYRQMTEILKTPSSGLDQAIRRGVRRAKGPRWAKPAMTTLASVVSAAALFVVLVNTSTTFAMAAGELPILKDIVQAVAVDPSLKAAVANQYVQPVRMKRTQGDITAEVSYLIADPRNLNLFLSLQCADGTPVTVNGVTVRDTEGEAIPMSSSYGGPPEEGGLHRITCFVGEGREIPGQLVLEVEVKKDTPRGEEPLEAPTASVDEELVQHEFTHPEPDATFQFALEIDPSFLQNMEEVAIHQEVTVLGQKIYMEKAEIYPTQVRLVYREDPENSCYFDSLYMHLEDEWGNTWDRVTNGIIATGGQGDDRRERWIESSYFGHGSHLTLYIDAAALLPKVRQYVWVDFANGRAENLTDGIELDSMEEIGGKLKLSFRNTNEDERNSTLFSGEYLDGSGEPQFINIRSFTTDQGQGSVESFAVSGYKEGKVRLTRIWGPLKKLDDPIAIPIQ